MEKGEPSFLPISKEFRGSVFVWPRTKVHRIDERYMWVPKKKDFTEDPRWDITLNGCECMFGKSKLCLVFDWVSSVKWDNVQQSCTVE